MFNKIQGLFQIKHLSWEWKGNNTNSHFHKEIKHSHPHLSLEENIVDSSPLQEMQDQTKILTYMLSCIWRV